MKLRLWFALLALGAIAAVATLRAPLSASAGDPWWNTLWSYRVAVTFEAGGIARHDKSAEIEVNFTALLAEAGESGKFEIDSLRVVEVENGDVIDDRVPFQFDRAANYDANNNAAGMLIILMTGVTPAEGTRRYHVYFDVVGDTFEPPKIANRVSVGTITDPYGFETFRLETDNATYHFHKTGGGFASLFDVDEKDWIAWNPAPRGEGDHRGVPNMVHPSDGGYFHPGRASVDSSITRRGPLKVTIRATSLDGLWSTLWEVYPTYATMRVLERPPGKKFWLLYEGTPGGKLDLTTDMVTRSDGTRTTAGESWTGDLVDEEWVFFTDPPLGRSLYISHRPDDTIVDSYAPSTDKFMTVMGFGRSGNSRFLEEAPRYLTIGLVDETTTEGVAAVIDDAEQPPVAALGEAEVGPEPPTPTPSPTATATKTPSPTPTDTPSPTAIPTDTPSATPTATATNTPSPTATSTVTATASSTPTATASPTGVPSATETPPPSHAVYVPFVR